MLQPAQDSARISDELRTFSPAGETAQNAITCPPIAPGSKEAFGSAIEKSPRTGAPLRNRTVDLLLTLDCQAVPVTAVQSLNRPDTGWH